MRAVPFVMHVAPFVAAALLPCASSPAFAWSEYQHRDHLTPMALELVKLRHPDAYPAEIWETGRPFVCRGAYDEDFPIGLSGIRATNHFLHPLSGRGLTDSPWIGLGDPDVGTIAWALDNANLTPAEEFRGGEDWGFREWGWTEADVAYGDMSWRKAIERYGYTDDSKRLAYYTLGFVCHLLEDMGAPEHVHDDPHGASAQTGFERWALKNWDSLKPSLADLNPRSFGTLEGFFTDMAMLGYSVDRFRGGGLREGPEPIDPGSDLARMFEVRWDGSDREWLLGNHDGRPILGFSSPGGGTNILNRAFEWNPADYARSPIWTKGHDQGEWWPTSVEIPGSDLNDEEGYYYIELSGDLPGPGEGLTFVADPGRNLYPSAYLPTPLPRVADQCAGWRADSVNGEHLYSLIASRIFPRVVEHAAGLVEHFYDIVNHPPYVKRVEVSQGAGYRYAVQWEDSLARPSASATVVDVASRTLVREDGAASAAGEARGLSPGIAAVRITFSEPVRSVVVSDGGGTLAGSLDASETVWTGEVRIEREGPSQETRIIGVTATDKNNHYGNAGGALDADPATPARRTDAYPEYPWSRYEIGEDRHYLVPIVRLI